MSTMPLGQYMMQVAAAEEMELRVIARLQELERQGVVRHTHGEEWEILDVARWAEAMGDDR